MALLRQFSADDRDAELALWQRAGPNSIRPLGRGSREALARQLASGAVTLLGLEAEGRLAGVALASHDGRKGWINRLTVDPEHRRRGYGSQLVAAAERLLRKKGILVVAALVTSDNEASLALLSKAGFSDGGDSQRYLSKHEDPETWLSLRIRRTATALPLDRQQAPGDRDRRHPDHLSRAAAEQVGGVLADEVYHRTLPRVQYQIQ